MFRLVTIEREYGCGGAAIAAQLADLLGWKLWDHLITEEIARLANVDPRQSCAATNAWTAACTASRKSFWRGSYERNSAALGSQVFDTDRMMSMMQEIMDKIGREGNAVVVGRGAPYLLRENPGRIPCLPLRSARRENPPHHGRRPQPAGSEELVDSVDRERIAYVKHYFNADWPTRSLYHLMLNTAVGNEPVIQTILDTMHLVEGRPKATDYEHPKVPASSQ